MGVFEAPEITPQLDAVPTRLRGIEDAAPGIVVIRVPETFEFGSLWQRISSGENRV